MTTVIRILVLALAAVVSAVNAQDFQGVAIYRSKRQIGIKLDSTKMDTEMQKQMQAMLNKQFQKTYILSFDKETSVYREDISLDAPSPSFNSGIMVQSIGGGETDILWKNTRSGQFVNQTELLGKIFLIKDSLQPLEWKLEKETKTIGRYTCYKATLTEEVEVVKPGLSVNGDNDLGEREIEMKTRVTTAWYTPEVPVNHGPLKFQGLPGLILEINDGSQTVICSKIVINPDEKLEIKQPKKGTEINQKDFEVVREKKQKEMLESFRGRSSDGETIQIRIGG